jgi:hypothetical protein
MTIFWTTTPASIIHSLSTCLPGEARVIGTRSTSDGAALVASRDQQRLIHPLQGRFDDLRERSFPTAFNVADVKLAGTDQLVQQ